MSTTPPPPPKKPAPAKAPPPRKRAASVPIGVQTTKRRRDWWPWNFFGVLLAVIFGTGIIVWTLRYGLLAAPAATPVPAPTVTALAAAPTLPPAEGSPVAGALPSPTFVAPDALNSGPYGAITPLSSDVSTVPQELSRPVLPPSIPAPHIAFSEETHDWGHIAATGVVSAVLTVANPGNRPLTIDKLLSNCSCLSGSLSSRDLAVGFRATLVVLYDPGLDGVQGTVQRTLTVMSTAGDTPVKTLTFQAEIP